MKECDLIMKGGTTSGVVYPLAILEIAGEYRLRSIGGTSAGAIAASIAAAAEYRRRSDPDHGFAGFDMLDDLAGELADGMTSFLQPTPEMKPVFDAFLEYLDQKAALDDPDKDETSQPKRWHPYTKALAKLRPLYAKPVRNGGLTAAGSLGAAVLAGVGGIGVLGLSAGIGVGVAGWQFGRAVLRDVIGQLKQQDFGILPGPTQPGHDRESDPGLIDWLADRIDQVSGHWGAGTAPDKPLTLGDLQGQDAEKAITLITITSDLTSQRPFQLPLKTDGLYFFTREEFEKVLPMRVVDWLVRQADARKVTADVEGVQKTFYPMPSAADFPVILAARMSLSFPFLIQAVPLWRKDRLDHAQAGQQRPWTRCLFSEGGISSNLPVHLFDAWLPRRPTFAIALGPYEPGRHGQERVYFSNEKRDPTNIATIKISSVGGFIMSLLNGAKDWQDKLQSNLPGFAERIAVIRLEPKEGGINLNMKSDVIEKLQKLGRTAGRKIVDDFDFDENRYRRALSILPSVEDNLVNVFNAYTRHTTQPDNTNYPDLLRNHRSDDYEQTPEWAQAVLGPFVAKLSGLGQEIDQAADTARLKSGNLPHTDAALRLVASSDLTPIRGSDLSG